MKCWGRNVYGELGNGTTTNSSTPVNVSVLTSSINAISAGGHNVCALTTGGGIKCWGWNQYGQVGNGTMTDSTTPSDVTGLTSGITSVAVGRFHACALTTTGGIKCWGDNSSGQLGNGTTTNSSLPIAVTGLTSGVAGIGAGWHMCAVLSSGGIKCWGNNDSGQLGNGTTTNSSTPVSVTGFGGSTGDVAVTW